MFAMSDVRFTGNGSNPHDLSAGDNWLGGVPPATVAAFSRQHAGNTMPTTRYEIVFTADSDGEDGWDVVDSETGEVLDTFWVEMEAEEMADRLNAAAS